MKNKKRKFNKKLGKYEIYEVGHLLGVRDVLEWLSQENYIDSFVVAWLLEEEFKRANKKSK